MVSRPAAVAAAVLLVGATLVAAARPAAAQTCIGDCNGNGEVTIDELIRAVNIALGNAAPGQCAAVDRNGDGEVTIDELIAAVSAALAGCPPAPTATSRLATATATAVATATRTAPPTPTRTVIPGSIDVRITAPQSLAIFGQSPIAVSGTVVGTGVAVVVAGRPATVSGGTFSAQGVALVEGQNTITAVATDAMGQTVTDSIAVTLDTAAPRVVIEAPADGARTAEAALPVAGMLNDIVSGIVGADDVEVTVNGVAAELVAGSFVASDVPLSVGANTITARATDVAGNVGTNSVTITRLADSVADSLVQVSGNEQRALPGTTLEPLVVRLRDVVGSGVAGKKIRFRVTRGDGRFADGRREIEVVTGADGRAAATYALGTRAGVGLHRVEADSPDGVGVVVFCATATVGQPAQLHIQSGDRQRAPAGDAVPEPFVVIARDASSNPVAGATVTFTRQSGGGGFGGAAMTSVVTDANGRAAARYTTGAAAADAEERVAARLAAGGDAAVFTVTAVAAGDGATTFSGIVLDNSDRPLRSTRLSVAGANPPIEAVADMQGRFSFDVPPGPFDLDVVGPNSVQTGGGDFPGLRFNAFAVPGRDNSLPEPIYLPAVDKQNELIAGGAADVDVPIEGLEGARLRVFANSVRRADGRRTAPVSASQVNQDKVPMPFPGGLTPPLVLTIQPADARFDPPAQLVLPNLDGKPPGFIQNLLSFDHDREEYVVVGTATVSEDGSELITDRGFGVIKGGWHGSQTDPNRPGVIDGFVGPIQPGSGDPGPRPGDPPRPNNGGNPMGPNRGGSSDPPPGGGGGGPGPGPGPGPSPSGSPPGGPGGPDGGDPPLRPTTHTEGDAIVMATGELVIEATDLQIPGRGFNFAMRRTYRSQYNDNGVLGHNWDFIYNDRLMLPDPEAAEQDVLRCNGTARVDRYSKQQDGSFAPPPGGYNGLRANPDGTYTMRTRDGFRRNYDALGRLRSMVDRNRNTMTFSYNGAGQLVTVTDTLGRDITFSYNTVGRLVAVTDFIGREVRYQYDDRGDLVAVRSPVVVGTSTGNDFPDGKTTRYAYSSGFDPSGDPRREFLNHNLLSITDPKGQMYLVNTYETQLGAYAFDRVVRQQYGRADQVSTYAYTEVNAGQDNEDPNRPRNRTVEVDPNGNRRVHVHNGKGNLLETRIETNRNVNPEDPDEFVFRYTYNADTEVVTATYPEGNRDEFTYAGGTDPAPRGNLLAITHVPGPRGGDQAQIRVSYQYEPIYNQHRVTVDPRGNDPAFVPQNGGANSVARYSSVATYDYQEGDNLAALATELGRPAAEITALLTAAGMSLNLGDRNGDGVTNAIAGNIVRLDAPSPRLLPDSEQAQVEGGPVQAIVTTYTYNRFGQALALIDPEGNVAEFEHYPESDPDGDGIETRSSRPLATDTGGYLRRTVVDARTSPRRRVAAAPAQIATEMAYDEVGNVIRSTDGRGFTTSMERNALNQVVSATGPSPFNYQRRVFYDANDQVVAEETQNVDTNGPNLGAFVRSSYQYNTLDHRTVVRREVSTEEILETRHEYDANENLVRTIYPEGNVVSEQFDERNRRYRVTVGAGTPEAASSTYTYDGNGNPVRQRDAGDDDGDGQPETLRRVYDGYDRPVRVIDAVGNETRVSYDPANNEVRTRRLGHPGGPTPTDGSGATNVLLAENETRFDELNRAYQRDALLFAAGIPVGPEGPLTPGDGKVTARYEFDRLGRATRAVDDNGHSRRSTYDGMGRPVRVVDELGNVLAASFDANGNLLESVETTVSPEGLVPNEIFRRRFTYDSLNRRTTSTDNLGNQSTYAYDSRNNLIRVRDPLGNANVFVFDGLDRRIATRRELRSSGTGNGPLASGAANPDGLITSRSEYDGNSRLVSFADDRDNITRFTYDALNRRTVMRMADGTEFRTEWDADSHPVRTTDPNGSVVTRSFDAVSRVVALDVVRGPGVEGTTARRFEYDGLSRITRMTENNDPAVPGDDSEVRYQFDSLSRPLREVQNGVVVQSAFDGLGNKRSLTYPTGRTLAMSYDGLDLLARIDDGAAPLVEYDYVGAGRILERRYGNQTRVRMHAGGVDVGYDGRRRMVELRHEQDDTPFAHLRYGYDRASNRRFELDALSDRADVYLYDSAYRLQEAILGAAAGGLDDLTNNAIVNDDLATLAGSSRQAWTMDGNGNWATQQVGAVQRTFTADALNAYSAVAGQPRTYDENGNLATDSGRRFSWDAFNRLVRVRTAADAPIAAYAYDATGRRTRSTAGAQVTNFLHDGMRTIEERDGAGALRRQFVWGRGLDELVQVRAAGVDHYLHENSLGSIVAATDSSGAVAERYRYDPYGAVTVLAPDGVTPRAATAIGNPYAFTGQRLDPETGYYYLRSRYYEAPTGRFLSRDPIGFGDGPGLYEYAGGNPINAVDPLGTEKQCPGGGCPPPSGPGFAPYYVSNALDSSLVGFDADVELTKQALTWDQPGLLPELWNTAMWSAQDLGHGLVHMPSELLRFGSDAGYEQGATGSISATTLAKEAGRGGNIVLIAAGTGPARNANAKAHAARDAAAANRARAGMSTPNDMPGAAPPPPPKMSGMKGGDILEAAPEPYLAKQGRIAGELKNSGHGHSQMLGEKVLRGEYKLDFMDKPQFDAHVRANIPDVTPAEVANTGGLAKGRTATVRNEIADPAPLAAHELTHVWQNVKGIRGTEVKLESQAYRMQNEFARSTGRPVMSAAACESFARASAGQNR